MTFKFRPRTSARRSAVFGAALAVASCAGGTVAVQPDARDARWAAGRWPGITVEDLRGGRSLFVAKCASCHQLPEPGIKTPDEWARVIGEMAPRAHLSDHDRDAVLEYLSAASARQDTEAKGHALASGG